MNTKLAIRTMVAFACVFSSGVHADDRFRLTGDKAQKLVSILTSFDVATKKLPWFEMEITAVTCYEAQNTCTFTDPTRMTGNSSGRDREHPLVSALKGTGAVLTPIGSLNSDDKNLFDRAIRAERVECWRYPYGKLNCRIDQ